MVLALLGLPLLAAAVALLVIDVDRLRPQAEAWLAAELDRDVEIGRIGLALYPRLGLRIESLRIANRQGFRPADSPRFTEDLLSTQRIEAAVRLIPLFSRRLEVESVVVTQPQIFLAVDAADEWSIADILKRHLGPARGRPYQEAASATESATAASDAGGDYPGPITALSVEALSIEGGAVTWVDANRELALTISEPAVTLAIEATLAQEAVITVREGRFLLQGEEVRFTGEGRLPPVGPPSATLDFNTSKLDLDQLVVSMGGWKRVERLLVEFDLRHLAAVDAVATITAAQLRAVGTDLTDTEVTLRTEGGKLFVAPMGAKVGRGRLHVAAQLDGNLHAEPWKMSLVADKLPARPLLLSLARIDQIHGILTMTAQLRGNGRGVPKRFANLNGPVTLTLDNAEIEGLDIAGSVRRAFSFGDKPASLSTDLAHCQATFAIRDGNATTDDLFATSPAFRMRGKGSLNLQGMGLDFHLVPKLVGTLLGQGDTIRNRVGLSVRLHVTGTLADPVITPTLLNEILDAKPGKSVRAAVDSLQDAARAASHGVEDFLRNALH